jgi:ATP-dependent Clp protease ATP-binding subunit ClpA
VQKLIVRLPAQSPPPDDVSLTGEALKVLREAQSLQKTMHDNYVAQDHILLALLKTPSIQPVLKEAGLTEAALKTAIEGIRGNRRVESRNAEQGFDALNKYAIDLTALAEEVRAYAFPCCSAGTHIIRREKSILLSAATMRFVVSPESSAEGKLLICATLLPY